MYYDAYLALQYAGTPEADQYESDVQDRIRMIDEYMRDYPDIHRDMMDQYSRMRSSRDQSGLYSKHLQLQSLIDESSWARLPKRAARMLTELRIKDPSGQSDLSTNLMIDEYSYLHRRGRHETPHGKRLRKMVERRTGKDPLQILLQDTGKTSR
jgi:hypothetical protein